MSVTLLESCDRAIAEFGIVSGERPKLVKTGLKALDGTVGGLYPGAAGILGMNQGSGKTSIVQLCALKSGSRIGIISTEDGPDVWGTRILSAFSGVDSLKIRRGELTKHERACIARSREEIAKLDDRVRIIYRIGPHPEEVAEAAEELGEEGCELVWLDYIQKIRGASDDRRIEISRAYTAFQRACAQHQMAGMAVSQFSRQEPGKEPRTWWLKESGDLENEARLILLGWRDDRDNAVVNVRLAKSTYGGEGLLFKLRRDESGTLNEVTQEEEDHVW